MTRPDFAERLLLTFIGELEEQAGVITEHVLALEERPDDPTALRRLFRAAHTVKGAAHAAGVPLVQQVCHHLESMLASVRDGRAQVTPELIALLLSAVDALNDARDRLQRRESLGSAPIAALLDQILSGDLTTPRAAAATGRHRAASSPPPAVAAAAAAGVAETGTAAHQVRVDAAKLDALLGSVGQVLALSRRLLAKFAAESGEEARLLTESAEQLTARAKELRLRQFAVACEGLPRVVRDLAAEARKEARFELRGADTEVDRAVLDGLRPALLHLVRNAVAHGIESPEHREQLGKPRTGVVVVSAAVEGDRLVVTVSDDGSGVDLQGLRARYGAAPEGDDLLARLVFEPGVSTKRQITEAAGRGVGLDAARSAVEGLRGHIDLVSGAGTGTTFTIRTPLTLAMLHTVLVSAGGERVAVPARSIERLLRTPVSDLHRLGDGYAVLTDDGPVRLARLAPLLGLAGNGEHGDVLNVMVLASEGRRAAFAVDRFLGDEELMLRPLERLPAPLPHIMGASIDAAGEALLVIDDQAVLWSALSDTDRGIRVAGGAARRNPRILVADDSITTRTLLQGSLEAAGYDVATAVNGAEALTRLREGDFDLLVSDVEMPELDGFGLCEAVRATPSLERLPIILVTGLETQEQRSRGLEAGADAYITKSTFDQDELLRRMRQLLG